MRLIDPKKIPKMGEPTTLEDTPMYEFAQCLVDYLVENYGVDVPDIVRCEDCKWQGTVYCYGKVGTMLQSPNDFCSRGERKERGGEE